MKQHNLGILGGGQLARMMLPHCIRWDLSVSILDKANAVCQPFCDDFKEGSFEDKDDVIQMKNCSVVTMDLEAVNLEGLKALENQNVHVAPSSKVIGLIQNKIRQKEFFQKYDIPTAPFKVVNEVDASLSPGFLKIPEGGYDGKGVIGFDGNHEQLPEAFKTQVLWEEKAVIDRELSILVARNRYGEMKVYEPTEMAFDSQLNLISYTLYPGRFSPEVTYKAKELALKIMEEIQAEGVLAVEMFLTKSGELWVNELAPRPHNSGHHTIESCMTSQFENHLRGVLGLPLGDVDHVKKALTFNVIGEGEGSSQWEGVNDLLAMKGAYLHNYGKKHCRQGRKMGHATLLGDTYEELIEKHHEIKEIIKVKGISHG